MKHMCVVDPTRDENQCNALHGFWPSCCSYWQWWLNRKISRYIKGGWRTKKKKQENLIQSSNDKIQLNENLTSNRLVLSRSSPMLAEIPPHRVSFFFAFNAHAKQFNREVLHVKTKRNAIAIERILYRDGLREILIQLSTFRMNATAFSWKERVRHQA